MPNLTRRARRRRRANLADQLVVSLGASAKVSGPPAAGPLGPPAAPGELAEPVPAGCLPSTVPAPPTIDLIPATWLLATGAAGWVRLRRTATAARRGVLQPSRPALPRRLEEIAAAVGLAAGEWKGGRRRLIAADGGAVTVSIERRRGGWEHSMFHDETGGRDETLDITEETAGLWFDDLFERVEGVGERAVWAAMARTLRTLEGEWQVTVELDVDLDGEVPDLEFAVAVAAAAATERIPELTTANRRTTGRRRWLRR